MSEALFARARVMGVCAALLAGVWAALLAPARLRGGRRLVNGEKGGVGVLAMTLKKGRHWK